MSKYYQTNAIYAELQKQSGPFLWAIGNAWLLVYGTRERDPKVLAFVYGLSWAKQPQNDVLRAVYKLSQAAGLPAFCIGFDDSPGTAVTQVRFTPSLTERPTTITLDELRQKFADKGLKVDAGACDKYLNDAESSAYHTWQRKCLGKSITVADLDLLRVDSTLKATEVLELKRSFADVREWNPYPDDFANFSLIEQIAARAGIPFRIVYNQRLTKPAFKDIPDVVSVFSYRTLAAAQGAQALSGEATELARAIPFQLLVDGTYGAPAGPEHVSPASARKILEFISAISKDLPKSAPARSSAINFDAPGVEAIPQLLAALQKSAAAALNHPARLTGERPSTDRRAPVAPAAPPSHRRQAAQAARSHGV